MNKDVWKELCAAAVFIAMVFAVMWFCSSHYKTAAERRIETVTVYDTVTVIKPIARDSVVIRTVHATLPLVKADVVIHDYETAVDDTTYYNLKAVDCGSLPTGTGTSRKGYKSGVQVDYNSLPTVARFATIIGDTIIDLDSAAVEVPITQKRYSSDEYTAFVSGFNASLDSLIINRATTTIYKIRTKRKHWGFTVGVQGGYGLTIHGLSPYAGAGFTAGYTF